ncbi:hypothetical protein CPB84DRAFT_1771761 [Gymnopilus junonius]|uniref:Uncharacterized protein n=1 Tax=Gymnopilus junonius TaxID=109634 RepID=A0A9P5NTS4_GYMJU|nr:hypothetical protein CPB84DRAFT_1771761 [Gymnopilus junonius]
MFKFTLALASITFTLQGTVCRHFAVAYTSLAAGVTEDKGGPDAIEFIGFHGGNSNDAAVWENQGSISNHANGSIPVLGDAVLGFGIYVTDDPQVALTFAKQSIQVNNGTTPKDNTNKVFVPENTGLIGDSTDSTVQAKFEDARTKYINIVRPDADASSTVRVALIDQEVKTGQMVIPFPITQQFNATCFTYDGNTLPAGIHNGFPAFAFNSHKIRSHWKITPENEYAAQQAVQVGKCA